MAELALSVTSRGTDEAAKELRAAGKTPAVVYGLEKEAVSVTVNTVDFERLFREASYSTIINLNIDGSKEAVLVKEIQYHPVKDTYDHIDFIRIDMNKEITADVSVVLVGTAPAVKNEGAVLASSVDSVHVKCLPKDLVHDIEVSIESLVTSGDSIHVSDIVVPEGIEILDNADVVIVQAMATRGAADEAREESEAEGAADESSES